MPSSTFFNLPEEKREKVLNAIKDEFSRVPFDKASINKIIQASEISRGSFYQYFSGKADMLEYILLEFHQKTLTQSKKCLKSNNGDIFKMFYNLLEFTIDFTTEETGNKFCRNLFSDIKVNTDFYLNISKNASEMEELKELRPEINFDMLDLHEEDDYDNMLAVLFSVLRDATAEAFMNLQDREKIKQKYKKKLELLKRGFVKNKE